MIGSGSIKASKNWFESTKKPTESELKEEKKLEDRKNILGLHVTVSRGDLIPKHVNGSLHQAYETTIRIKNLSGGVASTKKPLSKEYVFDNYRKLATDLNDKLVNYTDPKKIHHFPLNVPKAGFGMKLNEEQLRSRCQGLSKWMNEICCSFYLYPESAKNVITKFLLLDSDEVAIDSKEKLILKLLREGKVIDNVTNQIVYKEPEVNPALDNLPNIPPKVNSKKTKDIPIVLSSSSSSPEPIVNSSPIDSDAPSLNSLLKPVSSEPSRRSSATDGITAPEPDVRVKKVKKGVNFNDDDDELVEIVEPILVHNRMEMKVTMGSLAPKSDNDKRLHIRYETCIVVLDAPALQPYLFAVAFDGYRTLHNALKECGVGVGNSDGTNIPISAKFPPTFSKSSLGISLTSEEVTTRSQMLHLWLGEVLQEFSVMPEKPQQIILGFFRFNNNDASNPENEIIKTILYGKNPDLTAYLVQRIEPPSLVDDEMEKRSDVTALTIVPDGFQYNEAEEQSKNTKNTIINGHIKCKVNLGKMGTKKGSSKMFVNYETNLSFLDGVTSTFIPSFSVSFPFDRYRRLHTEIELLGYKNDKQKEIGDMFPTHSQIGGSLNRNMLERRCASLNTWFGELLMEFWNLSEDTQDEIISFLNLEIDDPLMQGNVYYVNSLKKVAFPEIFVNVDEVQEDNEDFVDIDAMTPKGGGLGCGGGGCIIS